MKTTTCPGQSNALRPHDCGGCKSGFGCYYAPAEVAATVADERARNSHRYGRKPEPDPVPVPTSCELAGNSEDICQDMGCFCLVDGRK